MVVLDTNIILDYLLGKKEVVDFVDNFPEDELSTTFVNVYELMKYKSGGVLDDVIQNLYVYHSSELSSIASARAYHEVKSAGKMMSDNDLMIFGVCIANDEILITQDKAFQALKSVSVRVIE